MCICINTCIKYMYKYISRHTKRKGKSLKTNDSLILKFDTFTYKNKKKPGVGSARL